MSNSKNHCSFVFFTPNKQANDFPKRLQMVVAWSLVFDLSSMEYL